MKEIIEKIKYGFDIAVGELFLFVCKLVACLYFVVIPLGFSSVIPMVIALLIPWGDASIASLAFKILFSVFQILALSASMLMVDYDEQVPGNSTSKEFVPSKDLVIALYVIINVCIWIFL